MSAPFFIEIDGRRYLGAVRPVQMCRGVWGSSQQLQQPSQGLCYKGCQPRGGRTNDPGNFSSRF
jgi:hypothetical protein